jgi:hypothetical protein
MDGYITTDCGCSPLTDLVSAMDMSLGSPYDVDVGDGVADGSPPTTTIST